MKPAYDNIKGKFNHVKNVPHDRLLMKMYEICMQMKKLSGKFTKNMRRRSKRKR